MNAWLQRHDFSAAEFEVADAAAAIRILREFDWRAERALQARNAGDTCDPGLGLMVGDGHLLHLCPDGDGRCQVYFHQPVRSRIPWLGRSRKKVQSWREVPLELAGRMIEDLFHGNHETLRNRE
jgi:hypothetical protein